jgi:hypothetical protein
MIGMLRNAHHVEAAKWSRVRAVLLANDVAGTQGFEPQ